MTVPLDWPLVRLIVESGRILTGMECRVVVVVMVMMKGVVFIREAGIYGLQTMMR